MKQIKLISGSNEFIWKNIGENGTLYEFEGFEYPPVRHEIGEYANNNGGFYVDSKFGVRTITWTGDLINANIFTVRRDMLAVMNQPGLKTLQITTYDDLELEAQVLITRVSNPYTHKVHTFQIEAKMPDPFFYAQDGIEYEIFDTYIRSSGFEIPFAIPLDMSGSVTGGPTEVSNAGVEASPIYKLYGPANGFEVKNVTTGESFFLNYNIAEGDYVTVDTENSTVVLASSEANLYSYFIGDFVTLIAGINEIAIVPYERNDDSKLVISFNPIYLGI